MNDCETELPRASGAIAPKSTSKRGRFLKRDLGILKLVAENRFVTSDAVAAQFWNGRGNRNHHRRLTLLTQRGYLAPMLGDRETKVGFRLARKGLNKIRSCGVSISMPKDPGLKYRTALDHDAMLLTLRRILTSSRAVRDYKAEHEVSHALKKKYGYTAIGSHGYKIPDALFVLQASKNTYRVALELEIATKSKARYRRMMKQLSLSPDWDAVFVIAQQEKTIRALRATLAALLENDLELKISQRRHPIYFIQLDEFLRDCLSGRFVSEKHALSLEQFDVNEPTKASSIVEQSN